MALFLSARDTFLELAHVGKSTRSKSYREEFDSASKKEAIKRMQPGVHEFETDPPIPITNLSRCTRIGAVGIEQIDFAEAERLAKLPSNNTGKSR
jgi:hypothetical protein